jgi:hypothetical protein
LVTREKAMLEVNEARENKAVAGDEAISKKLSIIIAKVLMSMGRPSSDLDMLKEVFEKNLIYTNEDVMVLTKPYCETAGLPWSLVFAVKQKIRASKVEQDDAWSFVKEGKDMDLADLNALDPLTPTPLPPQVANDPRKLARFSEKKRNMEGKYQDDGFGFSTSSTVPTIGGPSSPFGTSNSVPQIAIEGAFGGTSSTIQPFTVDGQLRSSSSIPSVAVDDKFAVERDNISKIHSNILEELQAMRVQAKHDKEMKDQDLVALSDKVTDNVNKMIEEMLGQVDNVLTERLKAPNRDKPTKRASGKSRGE